MQTLIPSCWVAHKITHVVRIWNWWLDGGDESGSDIGSETGRHGEFGNIFFLFYCCGDTLLAEELQAGDAVLHSHNVQRWAARQEQTRVPVTPAQCSDGALCWCVQCVNVFTPNIVELNNSISGGGGAGWVRGKHCPFHPCYCKEVPL